MMIQGISYINSGESCYLVRNIKLISAFLLSTVTTTPRAVKLEENLLTQNAEESIFVVHAEKAIDTVDELGLLTPEASDHAAIAFLKKILKNRLLMTRVGRKAVEFFVVAGVLSLSAIPFLIKSGYISTSNNKDVKGGQDKIKEMQGTIKEKDKEADGLRQDLAVAKTTVEIKREELKTLRKSKEDSEKKVADVSVKLMVEEMRANKLQEELSCKNTETADLRKRLGELEEMLSYFKNKNLGV